MRTFINPLSEESDAPEARFDNLSIKELKYFAGLSDSIGEVPQKNILKRMKKMVMALPEEELAQFWRQKSTKNLPKIVKSNPEKAYRIWAMKARKNPPLKLLLKKRPDSLALLYFGFLNRVVDYKTARRILKRLPSSSVMPSSPKEVPTGASDSEKTVTGKETLIQNSKGKWVKVPKARVKAFDNNMSIDDAQPELPTGDKYAAPLMKDDDIVADNVTAKDVREIELIMGDLPEPPDLDTHIKEAEKVTQAHKGSLVRRKEALASLAPEGTEVKARVKSIFSAVGKVARKPKYGTAKNLQDVTGARLIMGTNQEVLNTVANLKAKYELIEEDDYITPIDQQSFPDEGAKAKAAGTMASGYRSYHMILKDPVNGQVMEVQVRTRNQNSWATWYHDIYKPRNDEQREAVAKYKSELDELSTALAAYFEGMDNGEENLVKPQCPDYVRKVFGCP